MLIVAFVAYDKALNGNTHANDNVAVHNTSKRQNKNANGNANANDVSNNGTSSSSTSVINMNQNDNDANDGSNANNENAYADADNGGPRKTGTSSYLEKQRAAASQYMQGQDQGKLSQTAQTLITNLFTFNSTTLSNGTWYQSCMPYVDYGHYTDDDNNVLKERLSSEDWARQMGQYNLFYAQVHSVTINSVYALQDDNGGYKPIVDLNVIYDITVDEPGHLGWDAVTQENANYLVHFNDAGQVVSVNNVGSQTLKVVRYSQFQENAE